MNPATRRMRTALALLALPCMVSGCLGFGVGETPVYGSYGYVGPWESAPVEVEGGYFVPLPYHRWERGRREEEHRREAIREEARRESRWGAVAPGRRVAAPRPAPRPIPSIPNTPRPPRQRGGAPHR